MLPEKLLVGTQSNAERKVFYALKDLLSSEYTVFHHLPVYRPANASGGLLDGEIDFLIVHPELGTRSSRRRVTNTSSLATLGTVESPRVIRTRSATPCGYPMST
jgi:hypothetical protein